MYHFSNFPDILRLMILQLINDKKHMVSYQWNFIYHVMAMFKSWVYLVFTTKYKTEQYNSKFYTLQEKCISLETITLGNGGYCLQNAIILPIGVIVFLYNSTNTWCRHFSWNEDQRLCTINGLLLLITKMPFSQRPTSCLLRESKTLKI